MSTIVPILTFTPNLWMPGCPVDVLRVRLAEVHGDDGSTSDIAQLRLCNISEANVKDVYVALSCADEQGQVLPGLVKHIFRDVSAEPTEVFGGSEQIPLPDGAARVLVRVAQVVLEDGSMWRAERGIKPLPLPSQERWIDQPEALQDWFREALEEAGYGDIEERLAFLPRSEEDKPYWQCACGGATDAEQEVCGRCGVGRDWILYYGDPELLRAWGESRTPAAEEAELEPAESDVAMEEEADLFDAMVFPESDPVQSRIPAPPVAEEDYGPDAAQEPLYDDTPNEESVSAEDELNWDGLPTGAVSDLEEELSAAAPEAPINNAPGYGQSHSPSRAPIDRSPRRSLWSAPPTDIEAPLTAKTAVPPDAPDDYMDPQDEAGGATIRVPSLSAMDTSAFVSPTVKQATGRIPRRSPAPQSGARAPAPSAPPAYAEDSGLDDAATRLVPAQRGSSAPRQGASVQRQGASTRQVAAAPRQGAATRQPAPGQRQGAAHSGAARPTAAARPATAARPGAARPDTRATTQRPGGTRPGSARPGPANQGRNKRLDSDEGATVLIHDDMEEDEGMIEEDFEPTKKGLSLNMLILIACGAGLIVGAAIALPIIMKWFA